MAQTVMRPVPQFLPAFLLKAEAKRLKAYLDSSGIWTIGLGHTGPEVVEGLVISPAQAEVYLREDLMVAVRKLYHVLNAAAIYALSENQWGALISFAFNVGAKSTWDIWDAVNDGRAADVPAQMMRFTKGKNRKTGKLETVKGLVHRRAAEVAMWNTADPVDLRHLRNVPPAAVAVIEAVQPLDMPSSGVTRLIDTPPASPKRNNMKAIWTGIGGGLAAAPAGIKTIADTLQGWNTGEGYVAHAIGILMAVGAALAVAALVYNWIDHRKEQA